MRVTAAPLLALFVVLPCCFAQTERPAADGAPVGRPRADGPTAEARQAERHAMVRRQIEARGVSDPRVLEAMRKVPRHLFVPESVRSSAYADHALPIGHGQTISQPFIVAIMTELLAPEPGHKVLEIGTGSGYQAAVLCGLVSQVFSIEIVEPLARRAAADLAAYGCDNVVVIAGDGYRGLPEEAPFDGIIVTAAPPEIPPPLVEQLALGGRMVLPVGEGYQELQLVKKSETGVELERVLPVLFVPMTGEAQEQRRP